MAVARDGSVVVVDRETNRLILFDSDLQPVRQVGGFGYGTSMFNGPTFVAWDSQLNLVVSDENNRRVVRYNRRFDYVDEVSLYDPEEPLEFRFPSGVAVNSYGELWVADRDANRIIVINNVGEFDRFVGDFGYTEGQLSSPEKIVIDERDQATVCDAGNARIMRYDQYGNAQAPLVDEIFVYPIACALDGKRLWVLDQESGIVCFDYRGRLLFESSLQLIGDSRPLKAPSDIVLLGNDRLLISDTGNHRLVVCRAIYEPR
jgi:DNA-binding beta-propeller fold protein YncE